MIPEFSGDTARVRCPYCSPERKKKNLKEMTLTRKSDGAVVYYCHHCDANGSVQPRREQMPTALPVPPAEILESGLKAHHYSYLASRGISQATADKMQLFAASKYFKRLEKESDCIGFPYFREGTLVSAKYRAIPDKDFTQEQGGAHDFFGINHIIPGRPIVIVEGEIDCLTCMEVGIENVISVPNGAPQKVSDGKVSAEEDKKFSYVWNADKILEQAPYIVLATDQDGPGQALTEELARRIGKEKCRVAKFDKKDLNDVLTDPTRLDAAEDIREIIEKAVAYPISGLSDATVYLDRINDLYSRGSGSGLSTGYPSLDKIYTVAPGQLTVVTGYPSSGKSNFVDQIMVNLAKAEDWKFVLCSFENHPEVHIVRLMEIYTGKRFFDGANQMSQVDKSLAFKFVQDHFLFIDVNGEEPNTLDSILLRAKGAIKRMGIRGMVIDPYNYIEMERANKTETESISNMLTQVRKFCMANEVHCWFVAHPSKMNRSGNDQPRPDGMSISGSMAWWAKADCGLTIHRGDENVEVAVWKCRYRWVGQQGETTLVYNQSSGTYTEDLDKF